jgi:hypothetical protein
MKRVHALALLLAAAVPAAAQAQLRQPPSPTETRPVSLPSPPRSSQDSDKGNRDSSDVQREESPTAGRKPASSPRPITQPAAQRPVYDERGQRMNGMRQAGENRVMDTRTGRYYDTVPSADGQRIVKQKDGKPL